MEVIAPCTLVLLWAGLCGAGGALTTWLLVRGSATREQPCHAGSPAT